MSTFHKPVKRPGEVIELLVGSGDPAELSGFAHDTAAALLNRVRRAPDPAVVDRVVAFADGAGLEDLAELWADAGPRTLPGSLWRLYLLRHAVREAPSAAGYRFKRGAEVATVDQAIAGSVPAPTPDEVVELADVILRGAFTGDFAVALERASAFARVMAAGSRELTAGEGGPDTDEKRRELGYESLAGELRNAAALWRSGDLH